MSGTWPPRGDLSGDLSRGPRELRVTSYNGRLDQTGILDLTDPSKVIGTTGYAILPVTVDGLTADRRQGVEHFQE